MVRMRLNRLKMDMSQVTSDMPYNPVSFVKEFMKDETLCNVGYAEKSKMSTIEDETIEDADFIELT